MQLPDLVCIAGAVALTIAIILLERHEARRRLRDAARWREMQSLAVAAFDRWREGRGQ